MLGGLCLVKASGGICRHWWCRWSWAPESSNQSWLSAWRWLHTNGVFPKAFLVGCNFPQTMLIFIWSKKCRRFLSPISSTLCSSASWVLWQLEGPLGSLWRLIRQEKSESKGSSSANASLREAPAPHTQRRHEVGPAIPGPFWCLVIFSFQHHTGTQLPDSVALTKALGTSGKQRAAQTLSP